MRYGEAYLQLFRIIDGEGYLQFPRSIDGEGYLKLSHIGYGIAHLFKYL